MHRQLLQRRKNARACLSHFELRFHCSSARPWYSAAGGYYHRCDVGGIYSPGFRYQLYLLHATANTGADASWCSDLHLRYGIDPANVIGHRDAPHTDPTSSVVGSDTGEVAGHGLQLAGIYRTVQSNRQESVKAKPLCHLLKLRGKLAQGAFERFSRILVPKAATNHIQLGE